MMLTEKEKKAQAILRANNVQPLNTRQKHLLRWVSEVVDALTKENPQWDTEWDGDHIAERIQECFDADRETLSAFSEAASMALNEAGDERGQ